MCLALVSKLRHSRVESRRPLRTIRVPIMSLLVVYTESDVNSCYSPAKPAFLYAHALNIVALLQKKGRSNWCPLSSQIQKSLGTSHIALLRNQRVIDLCRYFYIFLDT
ncbi:uncharacterized protein LOC116415927 isoform X3 [Nasonia vitripennis]|uniref:Uncharacterized protein n=1 Tax=Nasonia vitripennis TaxID=7425 RepID=A0A7M7PW31_NASVI|nr:uncharacterized protein LOC116415927 isoform X3 [Nasonia vitripennis]